jgi:hypothetical protein
MYEKRMSSFPVEFIPTKTSRAQLLPLTFHDQPPSFFRNFQFANHGSTLQFLPYTIEDTILDSRGKITSNDIPVANAFTSYAIRLDYVQESIERWPPNVMVSYSYKYKTPKLTLQQTSNDDSYLPILVNNQPVQGTRLLHDGDIVQLLPDLPDSNQTFQYKVVFRPENIVLELNVEFTDPDTGSLEEYTWQLSEQGKYEIILTKYTKWMFVSDSYEIRSFFQSEYPYVHFADNEDEGVEMWEDNTLLFLNSKKTFVYIEGEPNFDPETEICITVRRKPASRNSSKRISHSTHPPKIHHYRQVVSLPAHPLRPEQRVEDIPDVTRPQYKYDYVAPASRKRKRPKST